MSLDESAVFADPHDAVSVVRAAMPNVIGTVITDAEPERVVMELRLAPPLEFEAHGYPIEWVRIIVDRRYNEPLALPLRRGVTWYHRNPDPRGRARRGSLCLWYPRDPAHLRWKWANGFEAFVMLVHKHVIGEEFFRRHGEWPWADAPHGEGPAVRAHPVPGRLMCA